MQLTTNLNLKKPEISDNVNIEDFNGNADVLDAEVTKPASATEAGRMSAADKVKLDGISAGAQVNTVVSVAGKTGAVTLTKADVGLGNVDNVQQAPLSHVGSGGLAHAAATTSAAGFMSTADKTKLDGIASSAQVNRTLASQAQAEAGTDNVTDMTPLRTAQAIAAIAPIDHVDVWLGTTGGSGTAYTTSANSKLTAYAAGQKLSFQVHAASGASPTLKPGTLAALPIRKPNGNAAKLELGGLYTVIVNVGATAFILQGEGGEYGTAVAAEVLAGKTIATDAGIVTGTMVDRSGDTMALSSSASGTTLRLRPSAGYRDGVNDYVTLNDSNFLASNIKKDVNLHGITGTFDKVYGKDDVLITGSIFSNKNQLSVLRTPNSIFDNRVQSQPLYIDRNGDYYSSDPSISNSLARYDNYDNMIWSRAIGQTYHLKIAHDNTLIIHTPNNNTLTKITKDNIVVYTRSISFANGWTSFTEDKDGNYIVTIPSEGYIRKYSPTFASIWFKPFSFIFNRGSIFDSDSNGNFIVNMTGGGETPYTSDPTHWYGFNTSGTQLWTKTEFPYAVTYVYTVYYRHSTYDWMERSTGKWWRVHSYEHSANNNCLRAYSTVTGNNVETINTFPDYTNLTIANGYWILNDSSKYQIVTETNRAVSAPYPKPNNDMSIYRVMHDANGDYIVWCNFSGSSRVKIANTTHYRILN
jgi:hypothetical protein